MTTIDRRSIPAELEKAVANAFVGSRNPVVMACATERMNRMRKEMRRLVGEMNWTAR